MSLQSGTASRLYRSSRCLRCARQLRFSSTTDAPPPLLSKIREDMKAAMRAKDKDRLNVIRGIISETNQLASGPNAVRTDMQVLALLKKRKAASQTAAKEAGDANREDLKQKQEKEIEVLDEYAGTIKLVSEEELRRLVQAAAESVKAQDTKGGANPGTVMKQLLQGGGPLDGKPVDKAQLAAIVKEALQS